MEMMEVFAFNMKKYRKKRRFSQMKLAQMLETSTSYIGEIEINTRVPSMAMVEKIAKALNIEPFRLFINEALQDSENPQETDNFLEFLSTKERKALSQRIIKRISGEIDQILHPETMELDK
ncbi:MAG: helix-turn-helix transcriptional regulator [Treponema sp.]|jgi:transcriptional regulator with XRE-family HTH domain|nr:helix-turn-helix transcriptional regulator [Treponema sp.]